MERTAVITPSKEEASNLLDDGQVARKFVWVAQIEVDEVWVQDGLDLTEERLQEILLANIGFARHDEIKVKMIKAPDPEEIRKSQGY